jgi:hypothetical protein
MPVSKALARARIVLFRLAIDGAIGQTTVGPLPRMDPYFTIGRCTHITGSHFEKYNIALIVLIVFLTSLLLVTVNYYRYW